jgi:hypothetical protein
MQNASHEFFFQTHVGPPHSPGRSIPFLFLAVAAPTKALFMAPIGNQTLSYCTVDVDDADTEGVASTHGQSKLWV